MGEAELPAGEISNVEIDWVSGEINVAYHTKDTVIFSETSNKTLLRDYDCPKGWTESLVIINGIRIYIIDNGI